jgi:hypothetical protein
MFVKRVADEIGGLPPPGMTMLDTHAAVTAFHWLQQAAGVADLADARAHDAHDHVHSGPAGGSFDSSIHTTEAVDCAF